MELWSLLKSETSIAKWVGNPLWLGFLLVHQQAQSNIYIYIYIRQELDHFNRGCNDDLYCPSCRASSYAQIFWLWDTCTFRSKNFVALRTTLELDFSPSCNFIFLQWLLPVVFFSCLLFDTLIKVNLLIMFRASWWLESWQRWSQWYHQIKRKLMLATNNVGSWHCVWWM